jgi:hypothetical protein
MAESAKVRKQFIDFRATWERAVNRGDLTSQFRISVPQASLDLQDFMREAPDALIYDTRAKRYNVNDQYEPSLVPFEASHFFSELRKQAAGEASWLGYRYPVDEPPRLSRAVAPRVCQSVAMAIRERTALSVLYQSLRQANPERMLIEPHAFGSDGFRWHARVYDCNERVFRDIVLSRILECRVANAATGNADDDLVWKDRIKVRLRPNQKLGLAARRAIAQEYNMKGGGLVVSVRIALLPYFLTEHRLDFDPDEKIEKAVHRLEVVNLDEVEAALRRTGFVPKRIGRGIKTLPTY